MPSPVAHSLIGLAIAIAAMPRQWVPGISSLLRDHYGWVVAAVVLSNFPDIDYLPGILSGDLNVLHHGYTHSIGWIALSSTAIALLTSSLGAAGLGRTFLLVFILQGSHLALDMATHDGRAPFGIMVGWPIDDNYRQWPLLLFDRISKSNWSDFVNPVNMMAVMKECIICIPVLFIVWWWKKSHVNDQRDSTGGA